MIKKTVAALCLLTTPTYAQGVVFTAEQFCSSHAIIQNEVASYNEEVLFSGQIFQNHIAGPIWSNFIFSVNQNTGSWSLVNILDEDTACFVASGKNFQPFSE